MGIGGARVSFVYIRSLLLRAKQSMRFANNSLMFFADDFFLLSLFRGKLQTRTSTGSLDDDRRHLPGFETIGSATTWMLRFPGDIIMRAFHTVNFLIGLVLSRTHSDPSPSAHLSFCLLKHLLKHFLNKLPNKLLNRLLNKLLNSLLNKLLNRLLDILLKNLLRISFCSFSVTTFTLMRKNEAPTRPCHACLPSIIYIDRCTKPCPNSILPFWSKERSPCSSISSCLLPLDWPCFSSA